MKVTKKLLTLILSLIMVCAMAVPAFAADRGTSYTITIKNTSDQLTMEGTEYQAYKIFDVTYSADKQAYSYTIADAFQDFTYQVGEETYVGKDLVKYLETLEKDTEALNQFAEAVRNYIEEKGIPASGTATGGKEDTVTIDVNEDGPGYYIVTATAKTTDGENTTVTALCALTTTDSAGEVALKADVPTVDKMVRENSSQEFGKVGDYSIGEVVEFRIEGTIPSYADKYQEYTYIFHDKMSDGLTLDLGSVAVYSDEEMQVKLPEGSYEVRPSKEGNLLEDGCSFEVVISDDFIKGYEGKTIYVGYKAMLNKNMEIFDAFETNEVYIEYSKNPYDADETDNTPTSTVKVYSYKFDVFKYFKCGDGGATERGLEGAQFKFYSDEACSTEIKLVKVDEEDNKTIYRVAEKGEIESNKNIVEYIESPKSGSFVIKGLDANTYYLKETKAPDGYNKLEQAIKVEIVSEKNDTEVTGVKLYQDRESEASDTPPVSTIKVLNQTGSKLPSTGGVGTTIFYVVGGCLMVGAAILLVTKKRMLKSN